MDGKWEKASSGKQLESVRRETRVTEAIRYKKDNRPLQQKRRRRLTGRCTQQESGSRGESLSGTRGKKEKSAWKRRPTFSLEKVYAPVM